MFGEKRKHMSYTVDFKLKVIKVAEETSNLEAGKKFGVKLDKLSAGLYAGFCKNWPF